MDAGLLFINKVMARVIMLYTIHDTKRLLHVKRNRLTSRLPSLNSSHEVFPNLVPFGVYTHIIVCIRERCEFTDATDCLLNTVVMARSTSVSMKYDQGTQYY